MKSRLWSFQFVIGTLFTIVPPRSTATYSWPIFMSSASTGKREVSRFNSTTSTVCLLQNSDPGFPNICLFVFLYSIHFGMALLALYNLGSTPPPPPTLRLLTSFGSRFNVPNGVLNEELNW